MARNILYIAFFCSGAAGLVYEVVWSRYLALLVGHTAEAQVIVIGMFLGGLAVGSLLVGRRSESIGRPLRAYALIELGIAIVGLTFHAAFVATTGAAYGAWFPAIGSPVWISALKWVIASLMIFVPAVLLGATFPLMAAGATRVLAAPVGRTISGLYFVNSFGGALFVLVAGFGLVPALGLPGTLAAAAALNVAAAAGAVAAERRTADRPDPSPPAAASLEDGAGSDRRLLVGISALTAVASFAYQIAWIRMLSLVMGSATHSFELMLSAFILGLALGAWLIRGVADSDTRPLRTLGRIQWLMGLLALATLPLYTASFGWVGWLVANLPNTDAGYRVFGLARYGIALAVMMPATVLAGMTLPLITTTLLRWGAGERAIGAVYGANTTGAILAVLLAGFVALPILGLKGLLVAGALLDMGLGVVLLARAARARAVPDPHRWRAPAAAGAAGVAVALLVLQELALDRALLTSGVFRFGPANTDEIDVLYYADGRTATIGVHRTGADSLVVLTSNGKPDASLTQWWLRSATSPVEPRPIRQQDEATQMLMAIVSLAHNPGARRAAVIGQGSGISGHFLLTDPGLESLVTIEIEPRVVDASAAYYPANRLVFDDSRSRIAISDAKSFFSQGGQPYDLVLSEPSNPWVSGTASLFSIEFYRQVRAHLSGTGIFAQWFHLYEIDDRLIGSVLAALHEAFPSYAGYLVGDTDVMVVAGAGDVLPSPDWTLLDSPSLLAEIAHLPPLRPDHLDGLQLFREADLDPLFRRADPGPPFAVWSLPNSDYDPVLDTGSERTRFLDDFADGFYGLAVDRFQIAAALGGWRRGPGISTEVPLPGLAPVQARGQAVAARRWLADPDAAVGSGERSAARRAASSFARIIEVPEPGGSGWNTWIEGFLEGERLLHSGTAGFADRGFYDRVREILSRSTPPPAVLAVVDFQEGLAGWDFELAAGAADLISAALAAIPAPLDADAPGGLTPEALRDALDPGSFVDGAAVAWIKTGHPERATRLLDQYGDWARRPATDLRMALLRAHIAATGARAISSATTGSGDR